MIPNKRGISYLEHFVNKVPYFLLFFLTLIPIIQKKTESSKVQTSLDNQTAAVYVARHQQPTGRHKCDLFLEHLFIALF